MNFTLDGSRSYPGKLYTTELWNGFVQPTFDKYVAVEILEDTGALNIRYYKKAKDWQFGALKWEDPYGEEHSVGQEEDGTFPLGAGSWVWQTTEEQS